MYKVTTKFFYTGLTLLLSLVALGACSLQADTTPSGGSSTNPIRIGASISVSGDFASDGKAFQQGYQLWQDTVNKQGGLLGRQVQFDFLTDDSTSDKVTANYQKMIAINHDDLVVGPFSSSLTVAASAVANHYHYAFVEGAGTAPKVFVPKYNNIFSVSLPVVKYLQSFTDFILSIPQAQRPHTVAYASNDDVFTEPQVDKAKALLEKGGMQTVLYDIYPADTTKDFNPIAQKVINAHPDIVILGTTSPVDCAAFIKVFKQQNFNPSVLIATAGPDQGDQFTSLLGGAKAAEGIFVPNDQWSPTSRNYQNAQFVSNYLAKYGGNAGGISADTVQAYSSMQVLEQAVTKINSVDNAKLIQELHSDTYNTLQGVVKFADDGENSLAVAYLFQWLSGQLTVVYPSSAAQQTPQFPKQPWT